MKYDYFISFTRDGVPCMCEITIRRRISSYDDILLIRESLSQTSNAASNIIINNYILQRRKMF